jgi:hypothetical protein
MVPAPLELAESDRSTLLEIARAAIGEELHHDGRLDRLLERTRISPGMGSSRGVFVTLTETWTPGRSGGPGTLRGCIGTMSAAQPLYLEVATTAPAAAFRDPRFPPLEASELAHVLLHISVLSPLSPVADWRRIEPGVDGVQLIHGERRAVFLPHVASDQGWGLAQLLEHLARKAGLEADGWRTAALSTFRADSFAETSPAQSEG